MSGTKTLEIKEENELDDCYGSHNITSDPLLKTEVKPKLEIHDESDNYGQSNIWQIKTKEVYVSKYEPYKLTVGCVKARLPRSSAVARRYQEMQEKHLALSKQGLELKKAQLELKRQQFHVQQQQFQQQFLLQQQNLVAQEEMVQVGKQLSKAIQRSIAVIRGDALE